MPTTRRKGVKKYVYKDEDDSEPDVSGDFSDSGSEAHFSEHSKSSDDGSFSDNSDGSGEHFQKQNLNKKSHSSKSYVNKNKLCIPKSKPSNLLKIKLPTQSVSSDEEGDKDRKPFSIKDLTESDKMLPSILNLSESDSSDDEEPKPSGSKQKTVSNHDNNYDTEENADTPVQYEDVWSKNLKESEEVAKQTFIELEKHKQKIEETKNSINNYFTEINKRNKEMDVSDLLAQGEDEEIVSPVPKKSKKKKLKADSDSEIDDWEEVGDQKQIPQQGLQLFVDFPDATRKPKKVDVEMMMRRKINRVKKEYQVHIHKVHLLCWLGHGIYVNKILNDRKLLSAALTLIPSKSCYPGERIDMKFVEQITSWYKGKLVLNVDKNENKYKPKAPPLKQVLMSQIKSKMVTANKYLVYIFVCILRAMGIQCRLMLNFVTLPLKPPQSELCSLSTKNKDIKKVENTEKPTKIKEKPVKQKSKPKKVENIPQLDGVFDTSSDSDDDFIMQLDGNADTEKPKRSRVTRHRVVKNNIDEDESPPKKTKLSKESTAKKSQLVKDETEECETKPNVSNTTTRRTRNSKKDEEKPSSNTDVKPKNSQAKNKQKKEIKQEITETKAENKEKDIISSKTRTKKGSEIKVTPTIVVTSENGKVETSKYFENEKETTKIKPRLSRKRTSTGSPTKVLDKSQDVKRNARTKSAPGETSKYFSDSKDKKSSVIIEDSKRVSHRQLVGKKTKTVDLAEELLSIVEKDAAENKISPKRKSVNAKTKSQIEKADSDDDFKPTKISPKPKVVKKIDRRVISSDEETPKNKIDIWCEVYVEELEQWIAVDVIKAKVHCDSEIYKSATHPVSYIIGWNNSNHLKDLTRRYVPQFNTVTRKQRVEPRWWEQALSVWRGPRTARDKEEDEQLDRRQIEAPLPKSIAEYKNHPLYALERHLLKFEAIYPPDAATLGFIRNEAVYARDCVYVCRSRDTWLKEAKVVKMGEKPYKIVKARPKWDKLSNKMITDKPLEVFGPWQTMDYEPPNAENGLVPRNAYGNVELFKECMLPGGTVHMKLPGLNKVAKKLNIDCAPAMTGFDYNGGYSHPVYDGFVVCKEFETILAEAWEMDQEEQERKESEKLEARVYGNWKRLIKGLLIRERLKQKYGFKEPQAEPKKKSKGPRFVIKK